jgi:hypothetical protein
VPGRISINQTDNELRAEINPVPYYVRNWQSLSIKKNAIEYAESGFWEENKYLFMTIATVGFCCVLVGVVIYFTYQYAMGGRADIQSLTDALRGLTITDIPGKIPK